LLQQINVSAAGILYAAIGMMHQTWRRFPLINGHSQGRDSKLGFQRAAQRPTHHTSGIGVQNHRQINEFDSQANVGDVRYPELVDAAVLDLGRQIRINRQRVARVGSDQEGLVA